MLDLTPTITRPASTIRPRRLRRTGTLRRMVRETTLRADDFVHPLFVAVGSGVERPISSMPGHAQRSVDRLAWDVEGALELGVPAVLLFGIPEAKDAIGSAGWDPAGPVPRAIDTLKRRWPELVVIADVCLCEYTDHGHCGVLHGESGHVVNDE